MTGLAIMDRPQSLYEVSGSRREDRYAVRDMTARAIVVEDGSVIINPRNMNLGEYYTAVVNGALYLYKKASDSEIEVYELDPEV